MPETTAAPKCRACIEQGIPGECADPAHQVAPEIGLTQDADPWWHWSLKPGQADAVCQAVNERDRLREALARAIAAMEAEAAWLKEQHDKDGDREYLVRAVTAEDLIATMKRELQAPAGEPKAEELQGG